MHSVNGDAGDRRAQATRGRARLIGFIAGVASVAAALAGVLVAAPAQAATGSFQAVSLQTVSDGYSFTNNPVDNGPSNGIIAINDALGLRISATTSNSGVQDAVFVLTKPSCWQWDLPSVNAALNPPGVVPNVTLSATGMDSDTLTINWTQAPNSGVTTQVFRAVPGPTCPAGSTWTPTMDVTDGSGVFPRSANPVEVRALTEADLSVSAEGAPGSQVRWFSNLGTVPTLVQAWPVQFGPAQQSPVGYTDVSGNLRFTFTFNGPPSAFELPRTGPGNPAASGGRAACWQFVSPGASGNGFSSQGGNTLTIEMRNDPDCQNFIRQNNTLYVYSFTPLSYVENQGCSVPVDVRVDSLGWSDVNGQVIPDVPLSNNGAATTLNCSTFAYGYTALSDHIVPTTQGASYDNYPDRQGAVQAPWASVKNSAIGPETEFMSRAGYWFEEPSLSNFVSYHFWDPTRQQIDLAKLDKAVLGYQSVNSSTDHLSAPFASSRYVVECTTGNVGHTAAEANAGASMTWVPCDTLSQSAINGSRFRWTDPAYSGTVMQGPVTTYTSRALFSQIPMVAVGAPYYDTTSITRWTAAEFAATSRGQNATTAVVGSRLALLKQSDVASVTPLGSVTYTLTPAVTQPQGTFEPAIAPNLTIVDRLDIGYYHVDLSQLPAEWSVTQTPADIGPDQLPYTADDVSGIVLTFTYNGVADSATTLPPIVYTATLGASIPPAGAPYSSTVRNTATLTADYTSGPANAAASVLATTPETVVLSKRLTSAPEIEVGQHDLAWAVEWANYTTGDLGEATFVDVFPHLGDGRGDFHGAVTLSGVGLVGTATQPGTVVELTTAPALTVTDAPGTGIAWTVVDPANPASWPAGATAIRITLPSLSSSGDGYGAANLAFRIDGHEDADVIGNDASGYVETLTGPAFDLGLTQVSQVEVVDSEVGDFVWRDGNQNGIQDSGEEGVGGIAVTLAGTDAYGASVNRSTTTDGAGAYEFTGLSSGSYTVTFDPASVANAGYRFVQPIQGTDTALDSDADAVTGEAPFSLGISEAREDIDAGLELIPHPSLTLVKTTNGVHYDGEPGAIVAVGSTVTWTYTVTNTGDVPLDDVQVSDVFLDGQGVSGQFDAVSSDVGPLAPGDERVFVATGIAVEGQYHNTATATGVAIDDAGAPLPEQPEPAIDDSWYFAGLVGLTIHKTTNGEDVESAPGLGLPVGSAVTWEYTVTNTGTLDLVDVLVEDIDASGTVVYTHVIPLLQAGESVVLRAEGVAITGQYHNRVSAEADDPTNPGRTLEAADDSWYFGVIPVTPEVPSDAVTWPGLAQTGGAWMIGGLAAGAVMLALGLMLVARRRRDRQVS